MAILSKTTLKARVALAFFLALALASYSQAYTYRLPVSGLVVSSPATTAPKDPAWSSVNLLLPFDSSATDAGPLSLGSMTLTGAAGLSSGISKFGAGALWLNGASNYKTYATLPDNAMSYGSSASATVEFWVYPLSYPGATTPQIAAMAGQWPSNTLGQWMLALNKSGNLLFYLSGYNASSPFLTTTATAPLNTWSSVALVKNQGSFTLYLNGAPVATSNLSGSNSVMGLPGEPLMMGNYRYALQSSGWNASFNGYIDEFRITGVARYSGSYTPATSAFPSQ
jgi:hypothetical protein